MKKNFKLLKFICILLLFTFHFSLFTLSFAEEITVPLEEVVVTASKIEEPSEETISGVIVITGEDIKKMNLQFVTDVLRRIPDLNLVQNGGAGRNASVFLRGGDSTHTLVMIDGVKVKSTTTGSFDFSGITVDDIERIEIVKGPQSTLYGSEAMSGVINIITKKGKDKLKVDSSFEAGSYGTYKPSASASGIYKIFDYRLTGTYFYTDGISAAKEGTEEDSYENLSLSGKFGFKISDSSDIEFSGRFYNDKSELDSYGTDDLNYTQDGSHYIISGKGRIYTWDKWEQILMLSTVYDSLKYKDPDTSWNNTEINTSMNTIDWQHNFYVSDIYIPTIGAEYREEKGESEGVYDKSVDNKAIYLNNKLKVFEDALVLNAGMRRDEHEYVGGETTYKLGALYAFKPADLQVRAVYATGFRSPTFNELFYTDPSGSSGNPDLKPEKSNSWEIGLDKNLIKDRLSVFITYFDQKYKDLIQWVEIAEWTYQSQNVQEAEVKGIETGITLNAGEGIDIKTAYTYLDTEDKETGNMLPRRPRDKFNISLCMLRSDFSFDISYTYVGKRYDDTENTEELSPYNLVNLSGSYNLSKNLSVFGRIENLLDEDYEEAEGYGTYGFSVFGGVRVTL
ncbi:MAG: TonB-dependent receptor [Nitrospirota bacterium]